ncbi:MAG: hypothetical protein ACI9JK_000564 [Phycisphaerales bacterium]|jgi:hypothetical protein
MSKSIILLVSTIAVVATILTLSFAGKRGHETLGDDHPPVGPDVVSWCAGGWGNQADMTLYGQEDGVNGFAFGTTSCNFGDMVADWYSGTNRVPVIAQTCYRVKDGRFEQIGTAWLKHSFCAVSEPGCGNCQATNCDTLGIGCADTYWAGLNANAVAPRSAINAFTGYYDYPFSIVPTGPNSMRGKLQIKTVDISPSLNEEAIYFIEAQYVSPDDAEWNNQDNNASYKWIKFINETTPLGLSSTQVTQPAIYGWKFFDHEVDVQPVRVPDEGLLHIGTRVYDNGDGTWDYVYAVHNLNSDRSVGSFSIPLGECVEVSNLGFNDVDYHSGEILDDTDWEPTITATELSWESEEYELNEWANAIRWGTTFTFWFTANQGPSSSELGLGLFKPGEISEFTHTSVGPHCPADCEGDVDGNGAVNVNDLLVLVAAWGTDDPQSDINNDGIVNVTDILALMADWGCA